jgi:putative DNA primase/helicase
MDQVAQHCLAQSYGESMTFEEFARDHGLMIKDLILDRWVRVGTEDHPRKQNGAYIFDGHKGAIINFAVHDKHILYKSSEPFIPDPHAAAKREAAKRDHELRQRKAADKAAFILNNAVKGQHPYLIRKGFPDRGLIWNKLLVLPMRVSQHLVGCQMIQEDGTKRFLTGQQTKGASLVIDNKGRNILCEGFATGMSVRRAMKHLRERYTIHVCFSAGNMLEVAKSLREPLVIADNDPMGVSTAKKIASRYWLGEAGEDFNDTEQRIGTQLAAESLRGLL